MKLTQTFAATLEQLWENALIIVQFWKISPQQYNVYNLK